MVVFINRYIFGSIQDPFFCFCRNSLKYEKLDFELPFKLLWFLQGYKFDNVIKFWWNSSLAESLNALVLTTVLSMPTKRPLERMISVRFPMESMELKIEWLLSGLKVRLLSFLIDEVQVFIRESWMKIDTSLWHLPTLLKSSICTPKRVLSKSDPTLISSSGTQTDLEQSPRILITKL